MLFKNKIAKNDNGILNPNPNTKVDSNHNQHITQSTEAQQRTLPTQIGIYALVVLAGGVISFLTLTSLKSGAKNNQNNNNAPKIVVDGKEYTADYLTNPPDSSEFTKETPTLDQYILEGERAVAKGEADYEVYVTLASMYADRGDIQKSIETYELAKKAANSGDADYEGKIQAVDQNISALKERM